MPHSSGHSAEAEVEKQPQADSADANDEEFVTVAHRRPKHQPPSQPPQPSKAQQQHQQQQQAQQQAQQSPAAKPAKTQKGQKR